ncbi:hypothetical protein FJ250_07840 [bacterium]|nr:hypothetical protein [bacterium]
MKQGRDIDDWRDAGGGFRGSHLLLAGAALLGGGASLALLGLVGDDWLAEAGWLAYLAGLGLTGLGFGWAGVPGILPRFALTVAALHLAQATYLLFILYGGAQPKLAAAVLSVGRLTAVVAFAALAAPRLGARAGVVLGGASGLALARTLARELRPSLDGGPVLDATILLVVATAIAVTGRRLRTLENEWARKHHPGRRSDFSEFNNPQHDWNRPSDRSDRA